MEQASCAYSDLQISGSRFLRAGPLGWQQAAKDIKECFTNILNAPYWKHGGPVTHLCVNQCCRSREQAEEKALWAIFRVILRTVPNVPLLSDWTKLGPSLDFFVGAEHAGILTKLLEHAAWAREFPQFSETEELALVSWQKLAGSRYARTKRVLRSEEERLQRTLLAVCIEPLRHLHDKFLRFAHTAPNEEEWPVLLSQVWGPTSAFVAVGQYFSSLLVGDFGRVRLMWQLSGSSSMQEWINDYPSQAKLVRNQLLFVCASVHRRFASSLDKWPFRLWGLCDPRRLDHDELLTTFFQMQPCCLPEGVALELRSSFTLESFKRELPKLRWHFLLSAFILKLSIAGVERRHAEHKQQADPQMPFGHFAAGSVLVESRHQANAVENMKKEREMLRKAEETTARAIVRPETEVTEVPGAGRVRRQRVPGQRLRRAQTPQELFKWDWLRKEKRCGRNWHVASKATWVAVKNAYGALSAQEMQRLKERAATGKLEAAVNRSVLKRMKKDAAKKGKSSSEANNAASESSSAPSAQAGPAFADGLALMIGDLAAAEPSPERLLACCPPVPKQVACQSLRMSISQQATDPGSQTCKQKFPLDASHVHARVQAKQVNVKKETQTFMKEASTIAAGAQLPESVPYPSCCGYLCKKSHSQRTFKMHRLVLDTLLALVKSCGLQHKCVSQAGLVLAAEQYDSERAAARPGHGFTIYDTIYQYQYPIRMERCRGVSRHTLDLDSNSRLQTIQLP